MAVGGGRLEGGVFFPELLGIRLKLRPGLASSSSLAWFSHSLFFRQNFLNKSGSASWEHILSHDPQLVIRLVEIPTGLEMVLTYKFPSPFLPQLV